MRCVAEVPFQVGSHILGSLVEDGLKVRSKEAAVGIHQIRHMGQEVFRL